MKINKFTIFSPGTCGELIQGEINGKSFLVSAPINLFSEVTILHKEGEIELKGTKWKAKRAIELFSERFKVDLKNISLTLKSHIPKSKGMGSSSADISALLYAFSRFYNISITPYDIAKIAIQIEPSDSIMFPGIVAFDYINGSFWEYIGKPLPLRILVVDFEGNIANKEGNKNISYDTSWYPELKKAFQDKNLTLFGEIITESTIKNQETVNKIGCETLIEESLKLGAVGVNTAHKGTVCGIFAPLSKKEEVDKIRNKFPHLNFMGWYDFIGGGHLFEI